MCVHLMLTFVNICPFPPPPRFPLFSQFCKDLIPQNLVNEGTLFSLPIFCFLKLFTELILHCIWCIVTLTDELWSTAKFMWVIFAVFSLLPFTLDLGLTKTTNMWFKHLPFCTILPALDVTPCTPSRNREFLSGLSQKSVNAQMFWKRSIFYTFDSMCLETVWRRNRMWNQRFCNSLCSEKQPTRRHCHEDCTSFTSNDSSRSV